MALSRGLGAVIVIVWAIVLLFAIVWYLADPNGFHFLAGVGACLILSLPLTVGRRYDLLSPWTLVLVAGYLGFGVRGLFISLGINGTRSLDQLYLLGRPPSYFIRPSLLALLGIAAFTAAYIVGGELRRAARQRNLFGRPAAPRGQVAVVVVVCAVLGFVGFILYAQQTGGLSLSKISAKRTVINGLNLEDSYKSHGELRVLNSLSSIALWVQAAWFAHRRVPHGIMTARGAALAVLFVNACLLPVYASTRADIVYIIIGVVVIEICLRAKKVSLAFVGTALIAAIVATAALTSLRTASESAVDGIAVSSETFVDAFILTRTFSDLPTAAHIVNGVPSVLPYADGSTIAAWLAAPIPRAIWPSKPIISSGPTLGIFLYGNKRSGVPPGMIAESYWNFGVAGILLLPAVCGFAVRRLYEWTARSARQSPASAVVVGAIVVRVGVDLMSNSIGYALFQVLQTWVLLVPVLYLVTAPRSRTTAVASSEYRRR